VNHPYSIDELPPFAPDMTDLVAHPRAHVTFACVEAPADVTLQTAWLSQKGVDAGKRPEVQQLSLAAGDLHMLYNLSGQSGPPIGFDASFGGDSATYHILTESADISGDPRVSMLRGIWAQLGMVPPVLLLRRLQPLHVIGQVIPEIEHNATFRASDGTIQPLPPHSFVVDGANDAVSILAFGEMRRMFNQLTRNGALVREFAGK
jgi:hypothetical protein